MDSSGACSEDETSKHMNNSSIESLEDLDWDGLLEVCKDKEEKLNLAGTYGLKLHEQLMEAQGHIDEMRAQHVMEIEKLVQDTFELKNKLDLKEKSIQSQQQEFETYQRQVSTRNEAEEEELRNQFKRDINTIKKEKDLALSDLEQCQLREKHGTEKIAHLEEKIQEFQMENLKKVQHVVSEENSTEIYTLHERVFVLEEEVERKNAKIQDLQNENQTISLELRTKINEASNVAKELEEAEMRSTSYFNHLQQAREEATDIKVELDALKAELRGLGHSQSGNSLFGELEDKRVEMEKKLLSMQVKHVSLQKAYTFVKSQLHNMKTQVVALLQMNSGRVDGERIAHLERALSQAKEEALALSKKMKGQEANQTLSSEGIQSLARSLPGFKSNQDMINFLSIQLEDYKAKLSSTEKELDQTHMIKLAESDKLQTAEQKLYETGIASEKYKNENMKLRLRLEELKNRLQAETQKRLLVEKKFNYDSTGDVVPIGVVEPPVKERKSLPYTLTKAAKEKPINMKTNHAKKHASFSTGMNWDLLPKEILKEFNIDKKSSEKYKDHVFQEQSQETKENKPPVPHAKIERDLSKLRKVSFKEEPETIIVTSPDALVIDKSVEGLDTFEKNQDPEEKKIVQPITSSNVSIPLISRRSAENSMSYDVNPVINIPKVTADNPECKMQ